MSRWHTTRIEATANADGRAQAGDASAVLIEVVGAAPREGLLIQVDPSSSHAVSFAVGPVDASARNRVRTLLPGQEFDTTTARRELQPGRVTAYTDAALDANGSSRPGRIVLNVTEITA